MRVFIQLETLNYTAEFHESRLDAIISLHSELQVLWQCYIAMTYICSEYRISPADKRCNLLWLEHGLACRHHALLLNSLQPF